MLCPALRAPGQPGELVLAVNSVPETKPPQGKWWDALALLFRHRDSPLLACLRPWSALPSLGAGHLFKADRTGVLHCFANSVAQHQGGNLGALRIKVSRVV